MSAKIFNRSFGVSILQLMFDCSCLNCLSKFLFMTLVISVFLFFKLKSKVRLKYIFTNWVAMRSNGHFLLIGGCPDGQGGSVQEEDLVAVGGKDGFESNESVLVYGVLFSPKVPELQTSRHSTWLHGYLRMPRPL